MLPSSGQPLPFKPSEGAAWNTQKSFIVGGSSAVNQLLNRAPIIANSSVTSHTDTSHTNASHTNHFQSSVSDKREGIDPDATPAERKAAAVVRAANKKKEGNTQKDAHGAPGADEGPETEEDLVETVQESFPTLLRGLRGRDHLVKVLVLRSPGDDDAGVVSEDGSMVQGSGREFVEEIVETFAPIPEAMLLTGPRPATNSHARLSSEAVL